MASERIAKPFKIVAILADEKGKRDDAIEGALIERVILVDPLPAQFSMNPRGGIWRWQRVWWLGSIRMKRCM
jgi:hypothetical protein